eukprot:766943-Hanusia_phi.AAC.2
MQSGLLAAFSSSRVQLRLLKNLLPTISPATLSRSCRRRQHGGTFRLLTREWVRAEEEGGGRGRKGRRRRKGEEGGGRGGGGGEILECLQKLRNTMLLDDCFEGLDVLR